jgi:serine/threonine protein kinase/Tol biopolymer transport system component
MTPERWEKVGEIFNSVVDLDTTEREAYLLEACGDDASLRAEVESLLAAGQGAGRFISEPVAGNFVADFADHIAALSPGSSIGHYQIEEAIGSGGMGEVYLATDTKLGRKIALKTLPPSFVGDPSFLKRFRNEAQAAANINHPNVATVYSVEEFEGIHFLTMEYIEGKTLDKLIPEGGLDLKIFFNWFEPLAQALAAAHKRGVIHRDIKPGNIMISSNGTPKILDFGLAQIERSLIGSASLANDITAPGQIVGTPSYMSPEQAQGADVDVRSDIFSLGTVMYEALTGKRPFRGPTQGSIVKAVIHGDPDPITAQRGNVPFVVAKMVARCLKKLPDERFQSMREICSILKETKAASDAGVSVDSFARRFYREATSPSKLWIAPVALLVLAIAVGAWWYFPTTQDRFPIRFDNMGMRRFSDADNIGYAQISPDGRSVAYATYENEGTRSLWIRRIDDRNPLLIVPPQRVNFWGGLAISNDGGQVFYLTAGRTATVGTLFRVSSLGGPVRKLVDNVNDIGGISPDGQRLLLVRYGDRPQIFSVNTSDGGNEQVILQTPADDARKMNFRDPHFSPDGKSVYYVRTRNEQGDETWSLESMDLETKAERVLFSQPERVSELAPMPDSSGIIITAVDPVSKLQQVFHYSFRDGTRTRLTNDLYFYFGVNMDAEGKTILVSQSSDEQQLWIGDANNVASLSPTIEEPQPYRNVEWTPDGRLVYDAYENNIAQIWISNADGSNRQQLTSSGADDFEPQITPDGKYIVFTSRRSGRRQVFRMNNDGGQQTLLADVPGATQAPRISPDGQSVVFDWFNGGDRAVATVPILGGTVQELLKPNDDIPISNTFYWAMSPDGKSVAYSIWIPAEEKMKIAVRTVEKTEPSVILDIWPLAIFKWSPDGKSIIYKERQAGYRPENLILEIDVATGKSRTLLAAGRDQVEDFSYSPDKKKVAVIRGRDRSNAVLISAIPKQQ